MTKYQDLESGKSEDVEYDVCHESWSKEKEANVASEDSISGPTCRWTARQGAKRRCGWVYVKLVAILSALLALVWSFKFGAFRFLKTVQLEATYEESWTFSNLNDFVLHNLIVPRRHSRCRAGLSSTFVILRAEQKDDVVVHFSFKATTQELLDDLKVEKTADSLVIKYPNSDEPRRTDECIVSHTEMHVRRGLSLNNLDIKYMIGKLIIPEALDLSVKNADIYLALASFHANQFDGRKTSITLEAGSVTGTFALLDSLSITTRMGNINATIVPKPADAAAVKPADFRATSDFGIVDVNFFPSVLDGGVEIPPRDYRTLVTSQAGNVKGRYLHGSNTTLETEYGHVDVALLPVAVPGHDSGDDDETFLATRSADGRVDVTLLDPEAAAAAGGRAVAALSGLQSDHTSRMGAVSVRYPAAWQGAVEGVSGVGRVRLAGEGLEIVKRSRKGVGMFVEGRKGEEGRGSAVCSTEVGPVEFVVGDL